jgi:hypothetical protein
MFYEFICKFIKDLDAQKIIDKFDNITDKLKEKELEQYDEYIKSEPFVSENQIKIDELNKKKGGQYIKFKTIPKWHHYAWDMLK